MPATFPALESNDAVDKLLNAMNALNSLHAKRGIGNNA
jgi:hypothetical protein